MTSTRQKTSLKKEEKKFCKNDDDDNLADQFATGWVSEKKCCSLTKERQ